MLGVIAVVPVAWTLLIADVIGVLIFAILPKRRRIAVENIAAAGIVADRKAAKKLGRRCFKSFTRMIAETLLARYRITAQNWEEFVTIEASPEARELLYADKQAAIVASGHIGNWDVAARAVSMVRPVNVVYRPFNNPYVERDINGGRGGENLHLISKYKASPMRFVKILAEGEILALMIDQHITEKAERVRVNFFDRPCWSTRSVAMMQLTARKPVLVACAVRTGKMKFKLIVTGPITIERSGDRDKDVLAITQQLTDQIEAVAREYPEQYLWGHRRWRD